MDFFRLLRTGEPSAPPEQVLAYLAEVQQKRAPCLVVDIRDQEIPATLVAADATGVRLVPALAPVLRKDGPVRLRFFLDGLRFEARATVLAHAEGDLRLALPHALALDERRSRPRAVLGDRDNAHATLLTGLFEGKALHGLIENLSMGGVRVQLLQAMSVARQTAIPLVEDIVLPGEAFALVRLEDLFRCPTLEVAGRVVYHQSRLGRLYLGVAFDAGSEGRLQPLREWLEARTEPIPRALPRKEPSGAADRDAPPPAPDAGPEAAAGPRPPARERVRKVRRLATGSDYRLSFQAGALRFEDLPLAEVSVAGCAWLADPDQAGALAPGLALQNLFLQHRDLPAAELAARVVSIEPAPEPAGPGLRRVEAEFVDLDPRVRRLIDRHIQHHSRPAGKAAPEPEPAAARDFPALALPPGWTVRFRHQGIGYHSVPMTGLSAQGCTLLVGREEARELVPGALLALFRFDQAELPSIPLQAQVVTAGGQDGQVELQVAFVNLNDRVRTAIHVHVLDRIGCQPDAGSADGGQAPGETGEESLMLDLGGGYSCRFRINGVAYQDQVLTGLRAGGCRFEVDVRRSGPFQVGALLQTFYVGHPDLPQVPLQACVSRVAGKLPGRTEGQVAVQVDFINLNQRLKDILLDHILSILKGDA